MVFAVFLLLLLFAVKSLSFSTVKILSTSLEDLWGAIAKVVDETEGQLIYREGEKVFRSVQLTQWNQCAWKK